MSDAGAALSRFDFTSGELRGTHITLYSNCLVHRGDMELETLPLAAIASVRIAYQRDARKLGWGIGLILIAVLLFAISGPLAGLGSAAAAEMAAAGGQGVARALQAFFRIVEGFAKLLPLVATGCITGGGALVWLGWLGHTTLSLALAGADRVYAMRGRNTHLLDFAEAVSEQVVGRLSFAKR